MSSIPVTESKTQAGRPTWKPERITRFWRVTIAIKHIYCCFSFKSLLNQWEECCNKSWGIFIPCQSVLYYVTTEWECESWKKLSFAHVCWSCFGLTWSLVFWSILHCSAIGIHQTVQVWGNFTPSHPAQPNADCLWMCSNFCRNTKISH